MKKETSHSAFKTVTRKPTSFEFLHSPLEWYDPSKPYMEGQCAIKITSDKAQHIDSGGENY